MNINVETVVASVLSSSIFGAMVLFIIKNYFLNTLRKDLENHKFSLQREVIKSQIHAQQSSETYKKIYELLEISYGATSANLSPLQMVSGWEMANEEDVEKYLIKRNASLDKITEIKTLFIQNDTNKAKKLNEYIRFLNSADAEIKHAEAKNFVLTNALYVTADLEKDFLDILNMISTGNTAYFLHVQGGPREMVNEEFRKDKDLRIKIDNLKNKIRLQILPQ